MDENPRRDLIISTVVRFGLTVILCSIPLIKLGVNAVGAIYALMIFAACSFMLSKPIMGWMAELGTFVVRQPHVKWQGNYYEFAGVQIRVCPVGNALWFVDVDILKVLERKPSSRLRHAFGLHEYDLIPGTKLHAFSEKGIERLLRSSNHCEAKRMLIWIRGQVIKPFYRRQEIIEGH